MSELAKIRVAVRLRPLLESELKDGYTNTRIETINNEIQIKEEKIRRSFKFDHVLPENAPQSQVYKDCEIDFLISKVVEGYHATIFAYGQTGSGKTFTMEGSEDDGMIQSAIQALFQKLGKNSTNRTYTVYCSFLQIYNEKIFDLLSHNRQGNGLKLRWNVRDQFTVENLFIYECKTADEVMILFKQGVRNRITASHKLNLNSSRSHTILELKIESVDLKNPDNFYNSKLELVDLAGSERISLTGTEGRQAKESIEINKSLMTLRQVIATLSEANNKSIPPYRDSKLTCLLKQSIGGNSFCLMIACLAPADIFYDENISTLNYATKAAYITNVPTKNDDPKNKIILDLRQQISLLKQDLTKANQHIEFLTQLVKQNDGNSPAPLEDPKQDQTERLVDSINMVRELLLSNKEIREKEEQSNQKCEQYRRELIELQRENFELREKLNNTEDHRQSPYPKQRIMETYPEQATQFQKNIMRESSRANTRASSQKPAIRQLPILQQFIEEDNTHMDELTNFGRRTLYKKYK
ncbi:hypothetical protein pb186bvf_017895 [Paramecium bursaria]